MKQVVVWELLIIDYITKYDRYENILKIIIDMFCYGFGIDMFCYGLGINICCF